MSRILYAKDFEDIMYGAGFYGAGGGGSVHDGLRLLSQLNEMGKAQVELIEVDEMGEDYAATVACICSPVALRQSNFGPEAVKAFKMLQKAEASAGKKVTTMISGELGGFNTMVPIYVAAILGIPLVNADGQGRAVPELNTTLYSIYGVPTSPLVLAGGLPNTDVIVAYPYDPFDTKTTEKIARAICTSYDMVAAFSTWTVNAEDIKNKLVVKAIDDCLAVGGAFRNARENNLDIVDEIKKAINCKEIVTGEVTKVELKQVDGFDLGITHLKGSDNKEYTICFKNENMIVRNSDNEVLGTVPDLICMVDVENRFPITNADIKEGMKVAYLGVEAPENWIKDPGGFNVWKEILSKFDYKGGFVRV